MVSKSSNDLEAFSTSVKITIDILYICRESSAFIHLFMGKKRTDLTEAEWAVINAIWASEPCTAPEITQRLDRQMGWSYSTVRTLMDRMAAKGLLMAKKNRNVTVYRSAITRKQAQRSELLYALKHAFNGALTPMLQCLLDTGDFSAADLEEIESLIRARKKGGKIE
jgi:predicted transcriptional regulator